MKTINILKWKFLAFAIIFHMFLFENIMSQCKSKKEKEIGISINTLVSSSGHGILSDLNLVFKCENSEFAVGALIQDEYLSLSGANIKYRYYMVNDDLIKFYLHYTFNYHINSVLSSRLNETFHTEEYLKTEQIERFQTFENYLGFGFQTKISKKLFFDANIGVGGYFSTVKGEDFRCTSSLCREDEAFSVMASIGIQYRLQIKHKKIEWDF